MESLSDFWATGVGEAGCWRMIKANGTWGEGRGWSEGWFRDDESRADGRQLFRRATDIAVFVERIWYFLCFSMFSLSFFMQFYATRAYTIDLKKVFKEERFASYKKKKIKLIR